VELTSLHPTGAEKRVGMSLNQKLLKQLIRQSLAEDIGSGDITTRYSVNPSLRARGVIIAKEDMVVCGLEIVKLVFKEYDRSLRFKAACSEGAWVRKGKIVAEIQGKVISILPAERTALNFLSFLSGIATKTYRFVQVTKGYKVKILDTRKTIPTWRILQKYAVRVGGGGNHRWGLWDGIILKENHLTSLGIKHKKGGFQETILRNLVSNLKKATAKKIEVEAENLGEFLSIARCQPDIILLDNFTLSNIKKAVQLRNQYFKSIKLEASGRINIKNIRKVAAAGVDFISSGSLTHSFSSCDVSLELIV